MNIFQLATEDLDVANEDIGTYQQMDADLIPSVSDYSEDSLLYSLAAEYSAFTSHISDSLESVRVATAMKEALENTDPNFGIPASNARAIMTAVEGLRVGLGHRRGSRTSMSAEAIAVECDPVRSLALAKEGIITFVKDVIKAIFDAIIAAGKWIYDFFARLFEHEQRSEANLIMVDRNIKDVEKKAEKVDPAKAEVIRNTADQNNPEDPKALNAAIEDAAKKIVSIHTDNTGQVLSAEHQRNLEAQAAAYLGTKSIRIFKKPISREKVPNLHKDGKIYKDHRELIEWITELQKVQIEPYTRYVEKRNIDKVSGFISTIIEHITEDIVRQDAMMDFLSLTFSPVDEELMSSKVVDGLRTAVGKVTVGDYAVHGVCPDTMAGANKAERHLGGASLRIKKVKESPLVDHDKPVPKIDMDTAKLMIKGVSNLQKMILSNNLRPLMKIQTDLMESAKVLRTKLEHEEDSAHLGHLAVTAVHMVNSTYINYAVTMQNYIGKIINEVAMMASNAANQENAILVATEDIDELLKKFDS